MDDDDDDDDDADADANASASLYDCSMTELDDSQEMGMERPKPVVLTSGTPAPRRFLPQTHHPDSDARRTFSAAGRHT